MSLLSSIFGETKPSSSSGNQHTTNQASSLFDRTVELPAPHKLPTRKELKKRERDHVVKDPTKERKRRKKNGDSNKDEGKRVVERQAHDDKSGANRNDDNDVEERTIFVGNLPLHTTRKSLSKIFHDCGPIVSTRIRSVAVTGVKLPPSHAGNQNLVKKVCSNTKQIDTAAKSSAQGYVVFQSSESLANALKLNNTAVPDGNNNKSTRRIRVDHAKTTAYDARRSVFVGNLPYTADESSLQEHFSSVCDLQIEDIEGVRIVRDKETFLAKGFGYVLFRDRQIVPTALKLAHDTKYMDRPLRVMVCGRRFKGKQGKDDTSNTTTTDRPKKKKNDASSAVGALRRVLGKQEGNKKKRRARATKKSSEYSTTARKKPGVSRRTASEAKVEKRVKKIQKRISNGMGKSRKNR